MKLDDVVEIKRNEGGHYFKIGSTVKVIEIDHDMCLAELVTGEADYNEFMEKYAWWICDDDLIS